RGMKQLSYATNRLHEVRDLVNRDVSDRTTPTAIDLSRDRRELVVSTLNEMDRETRSGIKLMTTAAVSKDTDKPLDRVAAWTRTQSADMSTVLTKLSGPAATRSRSSLGLL